MYSQASAPHITRIILFIKDIPGNPIQISTRGQKISP
jgi:hypothetical protein